MRTQRRHEHGVVMFLTVLLLAMMGGLGLAALDSATRDRDSAGYYNRETSSFYAAEAGIAHARAIIRGVASTDELPAFPSENAKQTIMGSGGGTGGPSGTPTQPPASYYGDPSVPNPIRSDGDSAGQYSEGMNLQSKGAKAMATLWTINVTGNGPDGASSRIEAKEVKFIFGGGY